MKFQQFEPLSPCSLVKFSSGTARFSPTAVCGTAHDAYKWQCVLCLLFDWLEIITIASPRGRPVALPDSFCTPSNHLEPAHRHGDCLLLILSPAQNTGPQRRLSPLSLPNRPPKHIVAYRSRGSKTTVSLFCCTMYPCTFSDLVHHNPKQYGVWPPDLVLSGQTRWFNDGYWLNLVVFSALARFGLIKIQAVCDSFQCRDQKGPVKCTVCYIPYHAEYRCRA